MIEKMKKSFVFFCFFIPLTLLQLWLLLFISRNDVILTNLFLNNMIYILFMMLCSFYLLSFSSLNTYLPETSVLTANFLKRYKGKRSALATIPRNDQKYCLKLIFFPSILSSLDSAFTIANAIVFWLCLCLQLFELMN